MKPGREYQIAATSAPGVRVWGTSTGEAVEQYARAFHLSPGVNVIARPVDAHEQAELYHVGLRGIVRLKLGGGDG